MQSSFRENIVYKASQRMFFSFWRGHNQTFTDQYNYLVPMGRMGQDGKDLKGAAVFLASEASAYVTGINLPVDGGMTAW